MISCVSCGAAPVGQFNDGSPRFACGPHPSVRGDDGRPDEKVIVELDEHELLAATKCGQKRLKQAERKQSKDRLGAPSLIAHTIGAQGEAAFSKWIGDVFVCTTRRYGGSADVRGCQVRTVTKTGAGLIVHETDPARIPVVSIVAHGGRFWLRGWIFAREAQKPEYVRDPGERRPAYFLPPYKLRPMADLLVTDLARMALGLAPMSEVRRALSETSA